VTDWGRASIEREYERINELHPELTGDELAEAIGRSLTADPVLSLSELEHQHRELADSIRELVTDREMQPMIQQQLLEWQLADREIGDDWEIEPG
jgi:hypothetical protein